MDELVLLRIVKTNANYTWL